MYLPKDMIIERDRGFDGCNVLYVSYDGLSDPLGKSQIIPYLKGLAKTGIKYSVLSFEKNKCFIRRNGIQQIKKELDYYGIIWERLRYHKSPSALATLFDVLHGCLISFWLIKKGKIRIIHARSYVAALIGIMLKKICGIRFLFDMRGFWADERVEAGIWKNNGYLYRIAKYFEKIFLINSEEIISLTQAGKAEIESSVYLKNRTKNISVIPTCVDLEIFKRGRKSDVKITDAENKFILIYTGSISTWFLPYEMLNFFEVLKRDIREAHFLVITQEKDLFEDILRAKKLNNGLVSVFSASYEMVPDYLSFAKVGLAFYRPGYSRKGCCPTKFGEYFACGLPVIINAGIGDTEEIIRRERVGIVIEEFSESEYARVSYELKIILSEEIDLRQRCRRVAEKYFSLNSGVEKYRQVYQRLLKV